MDESFPPIANSFEILVYEKVNDMIEALSEFNSMEDMAFFIPMWNAHENRNQREKSTLQPYCEEIIKMFMSEKNPYDPSGQSKLIDIYGYAFIAAFVIQCIFKLIFRDDPELPGLIKTILLLFNEMSKTNSLNIVLNENNTRFITITNF
jgi:hypothetical protein